MRICHGYAVLLLLCWFSVLGFPSSATVSETGPDGVTFTNVFSSNSFAVETTPTPYAPEVIWQYSEVTGLTQKVCPIGFNSNFVFTGGWYGGGRMFNGTGGDGTVLWTAEPEVGAGEYWTSLATGTAAAETDDLFYEIQVWSVYNDNGTPGSPGDDYLVSEGNTSVKLYNGASQTPIWTYSGSGTFRGGYVDAPGQYACSSDGSVFAAGGAIGGHLAIQFFSSTSSVPIATYEDPAIPYYPRQLRITADGSKCIFRVAGILYRVDTATGALEASMALDASNDCFAISPDGSVVAYGFTAARVAVWDGSAYHLTIGKAITGYYGGAAAIAADNSTIYFGFYRNDYKTNRILRFDISSSTPVWTYDTPTGSGSYQDLVAWMDCSQDGRWVVTGSWGSQSGGGAEVEVFDDENPSEPVFSINTPGSIFHVDMSADGRYISAAGKHVHANQMGSGTDVYFAEATVLSIDEPELPGSPGLISLSPNPARDLLNVRFSLPAAGSVGIEIFDLSGRTVQTIAESYMPGGVNNLSFSTDLVTGIYICKLTSGGEASAAKLIITR
jgi:hypothetical protein